MSLVTRTFDALANIIYYLKTITAFLYSTPMWSRFGKFLLRSWEIIMKVPASRIWLRDTISSVMKREDLIKHGDGKHHEGFRELSPNKLPTITGLAYDELPESLMLVILRLQQDYPAPQNAIQPFLFVFCFSIYLTCNIFQGSRHRLPTHTPGSEP
jgi:hypothetical protein